MGVALSELEFQLFQKLIMEKCGIEITEDKSYLIESRLSKILIDSKLISFGELYAHIQQSNNAALVGKLIDAITTNETLWFRDKTPWKILEELYMPKFCEQIRSGAKNKIRIWSAATSTGQEAYSTAICIDNYLKLRFIKDVTLEDFEIIGTDISKHVLEIAKRGKYDNIAIMRGLDPSIKSRYFTNVGNAWEISDEIKKAVSFREFNLQNSFYIFGKFDFIFCRYVLIYFSEALKSDIISRLYESLSPNGVLFFGAYELLGSMSTCFYKREYGNGIYYEKLVEKEGM